jgi:hypothetical protein
MGCNASVKIAVIFWLLLWTVSTASATTTPVGYRFGPGFNLSAVTKALRDQHVTAFPLLSAWRQLFGVKAVETYDQTNGKMLRAEMDTAGTPIGSDFPLTENGALFVYADSGAQLTLGDNQSCAVVTLSTGFNLVSYACAPADYAAREMIQSLGTAALLSISRFEKQSAKWSTVAVNGTVIVGDDFPIVAGEGYIVYTAAAVTGWEPPVPSIATVTPQHLLVNQPPATVTIDGKYFKPDSVVLSNGAPLSTTYVSATQLTATIPTQSVAGSLALTVKNPDTFHAGGFFISNPVSFPIDPPSFVFTPATLSVRQEESGALLNLTIPFAAPAGGVTATLTSSNVAVLIVPSGVLIPAGATAVSVPLTPLNTGNTANDIVTVTASQSGWGTGQATVTVKPKPTVNLSPLTTLTGLTFTYILTVNLTDIAPPGGLPVTLTASPAGIVNLPASVTIPAGATSAQVTVTATAVGTATITASAPGLAISGAQNAVTVKPVQTVDYGPVLALPLGIMVTPSPASSTAAVTYTPVASPEVGVTVGSAVSGVTPGHGAVGSTALTVTVTGFGLSGVTGISFQPADGITVRAGSLSAAADGLSTTVVVDIDPGAPIGDRTVVVTAGAATVGPTVTGADIFRVTYPAPQLLSIIPTSGITGTTFPFHVNGRYLFNASAVSFTPPDGISVGNPPTVSPDGTLATLNIAIDAAASATTRTVTITTPAGTTSAAAAPANTFQVKPPPSGTTVYPQYGPVASSEVGVLVQPAPVGTSRNVTYQPVASDVVGVAVGSVVTGVVPGTGAIGTAGLKVKVLGTGLSNATGISFQPASGIAIQAGTFVIGADGNPEVIVNIDASAPTTMRTVLVALPSGTAPPAGTGADQFRVTLPEPQILSMQPIRAMVGQTVTMNVFGKNFTSAAAIDFIPSTGISVSNPPTVSPDGSMATATLAIAANAPIGDRVVTISTPGWTTTSAPSPANTFHVTADAGTTYTPLASLPVGVSVTTATPTVQIVDYGPVPSAGVGVLVTPAAAPTTRDVTYQPVTSAQVGVAVGGVLTGMTPTVIVPGTTATFILTGVGLNAVTSVTAAPSTGIMVGTWTPAADGLSGTVVLTADPAATGVRTIFTQTAAGVLQPAGGAVGQLLVGPPPTINSISPTLPTVGTSFTLTINGTHLQGGTRVQIVPSNDVEVDAQPVYTVDGTGEHVTVRVTIGAAAAPGDRVVVLTTSYGVTATIASPANTITFFKPLAKNDAAPLSPEAQRGIVANRSWTPAWPPPARRGPEAGQGEGMTLGASPRTVHPGWSPSGRGVGATPTAVALRVSGAPYGSMLRAAYLFAGYRGPPTC